MELKVVKTTGSDITLKRTEYTLTVSPFDTGIRGTQTSLFTAKGQILVASGAGSPAVLNPGSPGQSLTPDPAEPTGMKWIAGSGASVSTLTNKSGVQLNPGDVVILSPTALGVTTTTQPSYIGVVGIVQEAIANNTSGAVATFAGHIVQVNCDSIAVDVGYFLYTSTTATKATALRYKTPAAFAVALSSKPTGVGTVYAMLLPMLPGITTPANIASLQGWWKSDALLTYAQGAGISSWADAGTAGALAQGTPANQPTCQLASLNGWPAASFVLGNSQRLVLNTSLLDADVPKTIAVVAKAPANARGVFGKSGGATATTFTINAQNSTPGAYAAGAFMVGSVVDFTSWFMAALTYNQAAATLYRNNVVVASKAASSLAVTGNLYMGWEYTVYNTCMTAEACLWERCLSADELALLFNYWSIKFGLALAG